MKKIIILLWTITIALVFGLSYQHQSEQAFTAIHDLETHIATEFKIPNTFEFQSPDATLPILQQTATDLGINIIRTSQIEATVINKYILLTSQTAFWSEINLTSGRIFTPFETTQSSYFLSTTNTRQSNQIGRFTYFGKRAEVNIQPLLNAFDHLSVGGRYFAELPDGITLETFLDTLAENFNEAWQVEYLPFEASEFMVISDGNILFGGLTLEISLFLVGFSLFISMLAGIYYLASQTKKIGVLKLNGLSNKKIYSSIIGKLVHRILGILVILSVMSATGISLYFRNFQFVLFILIATITTYFIIYLATLLTFIAIKLIPISHVIKKRSGTGLIFWINTLLKIGVGTAVILLGFSSIESLSYIRERENQLASWDESRYFGVWPVIYGLGFSPDERDYLAFRHLYPFLNEMGSILINADDYENWRLGPEGNGIKNNDINQMYDLGGGDGVLWRSLRVNPNYLNAFPIYDIDGNQITISEDDERFIFLLPEKYKGNEAFIVAYFEDLRAWQAAGEYNWYGRIISESLINPEMYIIWMRNDQNIFSFNPDVLPQYGNYTLNPIIQVVTLENQFVNDVFMMSGSGARENVKIRLIDGDSALTYQYLLPLLQEHGLERTIRGIVTVNEAVLQEIANLRMLFTTIAFTFAILLTVALMLVLQNTGIFFNRYKQKFVIHRIVGYGVLKTYKNFILYFIAISLTPPLLAILLTSDSISTSLLAFTIVSEAFLSAFMINKLEKKNKLAVVKGE